jgi:hypothetical protein
MKMKLINALYIQGIFLIAQSMNLPHSLHKSCALQEDMTDQTREVGICETSPFLPFPRPIGRVSLQGFWAARD